MDRTSQRDALASRRSILGVVLVTTVSFAGLIAVSHRTSASHAGELTFGNPSGVGRW